MRPPAVRLRAPFAAPFAALLASCALVAACDRPPPVPGEECELNTDCDAPLVCRLGRCRVECRAQRDCAAGLQCVRDPEGLGVCQIEEETECTLASECPPGLVCRFGQCTNACESDRDCPPGARCLEEPGGGRGCRDQAEVECELNSDCVAPLICATDERCRPECREDRDCRDGRVCATELATPVCVAPDDRTDGGVDGGARDGGPPDDDGGSTTADGGMAIVTPPAPPSLAAGADHTCGVDATDALFCWGDNASAQLAEPTFTAQPSAYAVGLSGVTVVGAGAEHSCALAGGTLSCWGNNASGQVGVGSTASPITTPMAVIGLSGAVLDVALGNGHTCALTTAGVFCWGDNTHGQLGDGTTTQRSTPVAVAVGGTAVEVSTFGLHTCVRLDDGRVQCFGRNDRGQLGLGGTGDRASPATVPGIGDAVQVATGTTHTCVLRGSGTVDCFGDEVYGQLGDGAAGTLRATPAPVTGLPADPVRELALGSVHSCARTDAEVYCWGDNLFGQLGLDWATSGGEATATATGVGAVDEIQAGSNHTCVRGGGAVRCWGRNSSGQLGNGGTSPSREWMPQTVVGL